MTVSASTILSFTDGAEDVFKVIIAPSPIEVGDAIHISIFAGDNYDLVSPYDNLNRSASYGSQEFEEDIDINESTTVTTNYPISNLISATYLTPMVDVETRSVVNTAGEPANVDVVNSVVSILTTNLIGTVRIKYETYIAQTWEMGYMLNAGLYVLFYKKTLGSTWIPLTINIGSGQADERSQPSIVTAQAKDFCTDLPIEGVSVYIDNELIGITDINGKKVVGLMAAGAHSIKLQASGYIPTDADDLSNESFQI